ncbi:CBS domain-containing protein [Methylocystis sp.]|uniref:CBS domain-containing protein n=1 Tax=Methylocystis sp. TaxID=1911079 RepID=UPI0011DB7B93|nr:CBS domain-containing protein [Methylocystis sp.]KAF0209246.1 MAG: signal transduction protein [Methylocystaceae bacterium]MDP3554677.1 CBS domain-containing protein [Methylocystis sp.]TXT43451.1 MAG: signal transduction protein [Methylocystaceae bacterium]
MTISNILAEKGREVVTASADTTLQQAAQLMMRYRIGALVILDDSGRLAGLIAERDIVSAVALDGPEALTQRIAAYMQPSPQPAGEDDAVENTMRVMTIERRRHIPVIRETRLVGLVSIGDVVKYRIRVIEEEHRSMREYIAQA